MICGGMFFPSFVLPLRGGEGRLRRECACRLRLPRWQRHVQADREEALGVGRLLRRFAPRND